MKQALTGFDLTSVTRKLVDTWPIGRPHECRAAGRGLAA